MYVYPFIQIYVIDFMLHNSYLITTNFSNKSRNTHSVNRIFDQFNFKRNEDFYCGKMFTSKQTLAFISDVNWLKGANEHCNNQINTQNCI